MHTETITMYKKHLYGEGPVKINPDTYLSEQEAFWRTIKDSKSPDSQEIAERQIKHLLSWEAGLLPWLRKFNGRVPKRWKTRAGIEGDLQIAKDLQVLLPWRLADAAVSHPVWYIRKEAAGTIPLNPLQLALVLIAPQPGLDYQGILYAQETIMPKSVRPNVNERAQEVAAQWRRGTLNKAVINRLEVHFVPEYLEQYKGGDI